MFISPRVSCVIALSLSSQAPAAILQADANTFYTVIQKAAPGDTVAMQGVFKDKLYMSNRHFGTALTLDASKAIINNGMQLTSTSGINIVGGQWQHLSTQMHTLTISKSHNISVANARFSAPQAADIGRAIYSLLSSNVTIRDNAFDKIHTAILINSNTDSLITRNSITNASSDGIDVANSHRMVVSYNHCSGTSIAPGAHPDCIQLWSFADQPVQSSIVLLNNVAEGASQGFTSFDPGSFSGKNFVFAGNLGKLSYPQGIACYGCKDSQFLDNTLVALPGALWLTSMNTPGGVNNSFSNNKFFDFRGGTLDQVAVVAHSFSTYQPEFRAGSDFDQALPVSAIPEPSIWLQLIAGFGLTGLVMRSARNCRRYRRAS